MTKTASIVLAMLLSGSCSAFQIRAPISRTNVGTFTASIEPKSVDITSTALHYRSENEHTDASNAPITLPLLVPPEATALKGKLLKKITEFREIRQRDQPANVKKRRTASQGPQKIDFYSISTALGDKAEEIVNLCNKIAEYSPITEPTKYLGDKEMGTSAPLDGAWRSLFTTAADADFPQRGNQKVPKVQNVVNAKLGTITNVVDFPQKEDGTDPVLQQLNVVIKAKPISANRVELQFKYAKAILTKLLWFKFKWALFIPVPPPFIVRCMVFVTRFVKFGRKGTKRVPKGYFDILYLDNDLRVHRTGEENYFVQAKEYWDQAAPLMQ